MKGETSRYENGAGKSKARLDQGREVKENRRGEGERRSLERKSYYNKKTYLSGIISIIIFIKSIYDIAVINGTKWLQQATEYGMV